MLGYKLCDFVSDEEKKLFTEEEGGILYDDLFEIMRGDKGSFAELTSRNVEKALVMMRVLARMRGQDPITSIHVYLFGNTLESETVFQMEIQSAVVKDT